MKIVISYDKTPYSNALASMLSHIVSSTNNRHQLFLWEPNVKSFIDVCDEIQPDVIICKRELASDDIISYVDTSRIEIIDMPSNDNLAVTNIAQINAGAHDPDLECEILVLTDDPVSIAYSGTIRGCADKFNTKVFGTTSIRTPYYMGSLDVKERANAIASCKAAIVFNEQDFLDVSYLGKNALFCTSGSEKMLCQMITNKDMSIINPKKESTKKLKKHANERSSINEIISILEKSSVEGMEDIIQVANGIKESLFNKEASNA